MKKPELNEETQAIVDRLMNSEETRNALRSYLNVSTRIDKPLVTKRNAILTTMLQERDPDTGGFLWTTADMLAAVIDEGCLPGITKVSQLSKHDRGEWLKKIQTRKQKLEREGLKDEDGNITPMRGKVGYKPVDTGFGRDPFEVVRDRLASMSKSERAAYLKKLQG